MTDLFVRDQRKTWFKINNEPVTEEEYYKRLHDLDRVREAQEKERDETV